MQGLLERSVRSSVSKVEHLIHTVAFGIECDFEYGHESTFVELELSRAHNSIYEYRMQYFSTGEVQLALIAFCGVSSTLLVQIRRAIRATS